jgi:hypothetical protein
VDFDSSQASRTFSYFYSGSTDLAGTTAPGFSTDYTMTVGATILQSDGVTTTSHSTTANLVLTIKNPCVDDDYLDVVPLSSLPDYYYTLYDEVNEGSPVVYNSWTHAPFTIVSSANLGGICGSLVYEQSETKALVQDPVNGGTLYDNTKILVFNYINNDPVPATNLRHEIYAEDRTLVPGPYPYVVCASYPLYPMEYCSVGEVYLRDPCVAPYGPFDLSITGATLPTATIDYLSSSTTVLSFPTYTVDPSICTPSFSCQYASGPYSGGLDLCDFSNTNGGFTSTGSFDDTTGTLSFLT